MMIKNIASKSNLALNYRTHKLYPNIEKMDCLNIVHYLSSGAKMQKQ